MISADDWPSHSDELGRKSIEQLEKWSKAYDAGRITKREFFCVVSAMYGTISGLAPREITKLVADIHEDLRQNAKVR